MRKNQILMGLWVMVIAAHGSVLPAGSLQPTAAPAPTMKTLVEVEPRTMIKDLAGDADSLFVITQPGSYYLTENITVPAGNWRGIKIQSSNVSIDLNGFAIIGAGATFGIVGDPYQNYDHLIIKNGTLKSHGAKGIYVNRIRNVVIEDLTVGFSGAENIYVLNGTVIRNCTLLNTSNGAAGIQAGDCCLIENCTFVDCNVGIIAGNGSTVKNCNVNSATGNGIQVSQQAMVIQCVVKDANMGIVATGNNVSIIDCNVCICVADGIRTLEAATVQRCTANSNGGAGILVSHGSSVMNCTTRGNYDGIVGGEGCMIANNTIQGSSNNGIMVPPYRSFIRENCIFDAIIGIQIGGGSGGCVIENNAVANCTAAGIDFSGTISCYDFNRLRNTTNYLNNTGPAVTGGNDLTY